MKRRSARPFTVEIKQTRTARAVSSEAATPARTGQSLWHDVPLALAEAPAGRPSAPRPPTAPRPSEAPARRILPSLVPMFALPSEPEAGPEPAVERPRIRRPKPASAHARVPAEAPVPAVAEPVARSPDAAPARAAEPASTAARTDRPSRKAATLRPGERWKRRLPRALW